MKLKYSRSLVLTVCLIILSALSADAQFVTLARKIKSMHSSQADVATVMLDAKPANVYKAVIDTLRSDPKFRITNQDTQKRMVEFSKGNQKVSMQIDSLAANLTQITVAAPHTEDAPKQTTDAATEAILKVCEKIGIKCSVEPAKK
jgi:hypothetical protein